MSNGLTKSGSTNAVLTKMPDDLPYADRGTIGMWSKHLIHKTGKTITDYLKKDLDYGKGVANKWDCEDRAYWGVSNARCKFLGLPMAVALGTAKSGDYKGQSHAVILFWTKTGEDEYEPHYLDPDGKLNKIVDFDPRAIITFPVHRPNARGGSRKDLTPFDKHPYIERGAFVLDRVYDLSKVEKIEDYLGKIKNCPKPSGERAGLKYENYWENSVEDRAFWAFIHARRYFWDEYGGNPIGLGVAFGMDIRKKKDGAVLVIWVDDGSGTIDYKYWDVGTGTIEKNEFKPRIVIA